MKKPWLDCLKTKRLQKSLRDLGITSIALFVLACEGKKETNPTDAEPAVSTAVPKVNPRLLIIPGNCVGNISLEQNSEALEPVLGKPDLSDAAMGKAWLTWFSKVSDSITGNELNVYTEYKDDEMTQKVVRQIRVTSGEFITDGGISTGKSIDEITKAFPSIKMIGKYDTETDYPVAVYDAVDDGIAFEAENDICTGIIVHEKGRSVSDQYMSFHPDMKPM